jgi:hypothetical protein
MINRDTRGNLNGHYCHSCNGDLDDVELDTVFDIISDWQLGLEHFDEVTSSEFISATPIDVPMENVNARVQKIMKRLNEYDMIISKTQTSLTSSTKKMETIQSILDIVTSSPDHTELQLSYLNSDMSRLESEMQGFEHCIEWNENDKNEIWQTYDFGSNEDMEQQLAEFTQSRELELVNQAQLALEKAKALMGQ